MKRLMILVLSVFFVFAESYSQKVGFISSDEIRKYFPEASQADQRLQSIVEEWKRELASIEQNIGLLEDEIKKNRLVWSDEERMQKENELNELKKRRQTYAKEKFDLGGEYDKAVKMLMKKIEEKIHAATQEVSAEEGFDIIFDKSVQPLPYVNFKYDLTVKVLRKLGVDTKVLEEELNSKITQDPRNKENKSRKAPSRRRKSRSGSSKSKDIIPKTTEKEPVQEQPPIEKPPVENNKEELPGVIKK